MNKLPHSVSINITFPIRHTVKEAPRSIGTNTTLNKRHIMTCLYTHNCKQLHLLFIKHSPLTGVLPGENHRSWFVINPISVRVHLNVTPRTVASYAGPITEYAYLITLLALKLCYITAAHGAFTWNYEKQRQNELFWLKTLDFNQL